MIDVVLVKVDSRKGRFAKQIPLGMLYVGSALKASGFGVRCFDIFPDGVGEVVEVVEGARPAWVGFSFMAGPGINATVEVAREVRKVAGLVVCGGIHPTIMPEQCLESGLFDVVVTHEGEQAAVELAQGKGLGEVRGVWFKGGRTGRREFLRTEELDKTRLDFGLVDLERYFFNSGGVKRGVGLVGSRGCPHACGFCSSEFVNRRKWRRHSVEWVVETVEGLVDGYGIDGVSFLDENFFVSKKWAYEVGRRLPVQWIAATHIEYVDEEFVRMVRESRCVGISFGLESGSDRVLKLMGKQTTRKSIMERVELFRSVKPGFRFSACVIFGYPSETWEELRVTLATMMRMIRVVSGMTFACGRFLPFPGCRAFELAKAEGFVEPKSLEGWEDFDRWGDKQDLISMVVRYVIGVQAVYKVSKIAGRVAGWLTQRGKKSWIMEGVCWLRPRVGTAKRWLGRL